MEKLVEDFDKGMSIFHISNKYKIEFHRVIEIIRYMKIGRKAS